MPIHDLSYRHWRGRRSERPASLVLAWSQLRLTMRRRAVRWLLVLSALGVLVCLGVVYLETMPRDSPLGVLRGLPQVELDGRSLRIFLAFQRVVAYFIVLAAGAEVIALDRRTKALQIYLARPLGVADYLVGKGLPIVLLLSLTSWVPALALLLLRSIASASLQWLRDEPWLPLAILAYSLLLILPVTLLTLAVSSLSTSARLAGAQLVAVVIFSTAVGRILSTLTHDDAWQLLSLDANIGQVRSWLFGSGLPHDVSPWSALVALLVLSTGCTLLLLRRVRPVDVVGGS